MFIISEISPQFGNDLDLAEQMILQSKLAGAKAAKVQLYPTEMFFENPSPYLLSRELSFDDFKRLKEYGDSVGLPVFATAFNEDRLEWCIELDQKYHKIAARMHRETPDLAAKILQTGKTVFVSVPSDLDTSQIQMLDHCIYLHCIGKYPTLLEDVIIPDFKNTIFDGISDHSVGISAALFSASRGAKYIEKHFTISTALQRSNETAHFGAMNSQQLEQIATISREFQLLDNLN